MLILVNGAEKNIADNTTVSAFIKENNYDAEKVVIEHNKVIQATEKWSELVLQPNDSLEIISFVGGG